jgi:hypothetical protein
MTCIPGTDDPGSLAVSSSVEEWEKTGRSLFKQKLYAHAVQCFQRASLHHEVIVAKAYLLRERAHAVLSGQPDDVTLRSKAFGDAAKEFIKCASPTTAESRAYHRIAAECFQEGNNILEAARLYVKAEDFDRAAQLYRDAGMFGEAMQIVRENRGKMQSKVVHSIVQDCRLNHFKKQEFPYVSIPTFEFLLLTSHPQPS